MKHHKGTGLTTTPEDPRDFDLGSVYGTIDIKTVPNTSWMVANPVKIKNQGQLDFCAAYMATEISEDQEWIELGPKWQFAMIKFLQGDYTTWGSDLRTAMLSLVKIGSIPAYQEDAFLSTRPDADRDWLANWENWPKGFKEIAKKYKKQSLFAVKGKYDAFDTVRAALWQHRAENRSIACGVRWRYNWSDIPTGIIPSESIGDGEGHALKICGQKIIDGEIYLVIQNSWGTEVGDNGFFYVNREVFNREFRPYGFFMVKDLPKEIAKELSTKGLSIKNAWWVAFKIAIKNLFTRFTQHNYSAA